MAVYFPEQDTAAGTMADAVTLDTLVTRNGALMVAEVGTDLVMLHVERNAYYDTDAIGADIWRRIASPVSVRDLCDGLASQYDVELETCRADVLVFLNEAHREGIVRVMQE